MPSKIIVDVLDISKMTLGVIVIQKWTEMLGWMYGRTDGWMDG